jgi:hypothetical protein
VATAENPYAGQGPVLLDIGGDVGALVVTMPAEMEGVEIEFRPTGAVGPDHDTHAQGEHDDHHDHGDRDHHRHHHDHSHGTAQHPHVAVVARPVGGRLVHSLVFPELLEGGYELSRKPNGAVELSVLIHGGQVTQTQWPTNR